MLTLRIFFPPQSQHTTQQEAATGDDKFGILGNCLENEFFFLSSISQGQNALPLA
jgi:hypothetical protein